ncbi:MAG: hypothetical protein J5626_00950, partial [Lachnospiraceae bacterium]|nr:hypothetical protein [Lachnospiraceae bacterium]
MKKSTGIAIAAIAAIFVAVFIAVFPTLVRVRKETKRIVAEEEAIAGYPTLDWINVDNIVSMETYEGDIVYKVTDRDDITKVMDTLKSVELVTEYVDPGDDNKRATGGPVDGLHLFIEMSNENESWFIYADDENMPTNFVIERTLWKNKETNWFETKTGYYSKADKIYGKVKAIMYGGERIDLNEVNRAENDETQDEVPQKEDDAPTKSSDHKVVNLDYNPDTIYTAETLDFVGVKGCVTKDIFVGGDKIYFCCYKDTSNNPAYFDYDFILGYTHSWGYVNKDGSKKAVFKLYSDDPEYPYRGMLAIIGATDESVYAVTFRAKN